MNISPTRTLLVLTACIALAGCKKYDDGPAFSLRSREERVANNWRVEQATDGGNDVTSAFSVYELRMTRDRDATLLASYTLGALTLDFQTSGTWDFENNSEDLRLDFENNAADATYQIGLVEGERVVVAREGWRS
ncbi:MAG: hypothetical protein IPK99_13355 [Flavobacteriales bacterium]|nr:hypothetical protein [Flavobacteriales bacterium]